MPRERAYTIEETAEALKVSEKTILRRIQARELKAIRYGNVWWVPQKSLRAWIFRAFASLGTRGTCNKNESGGLKSEQLRGQAAGASGFRLRERVEPAALKGRISEPATAAVELQGSFRYL